MGVGAPGPPTTTSLPRGVNREGEIEWLGSMLLACALVGSRHSLRLGVHDPMQVVIEQLALDLETSGVLLVGERVVVLLVHVVVVHGASEFWHITEGTHIGESHILLLRSHGGWSTVDSRNAAW